MQNLGSSSTEAGISHKGAVEYNCLIFQTYLRLALIRGYCMSAPVFIKFI